MLHCVLCASAHVLHVKHHISDILSERIFRREGELQPDKVVGSENKFEAKMRAVSLLLLHCVLSASAQDQDGCEFLHIII